MNLAILFWFYKDINLCKNRLELLRKYNPNIPIFGLYGGNPDESNKFKQELIQYLDDFYCFTDIVESDWKWNHGDLLINEWYKVKGVNLKWDTIVVVQWDMLLLASVKKLFKSLKKDEILLSGLRPVSEVKDWWSYLVSGNSIGPPGALEFKKFLKHICLEYKYKDTPQCCQFVVACLPRVFFEKYIHIKKPKLGFIEYKIPIYAQIFDIKFCTDHRYDPWWPTEPKTINVNRNLITLTADTKKIPFKTVLKNHVNPFGARVFHPVTYSYPIDLFDFKSLYWIFLGYVKKLRMFI